MKRIKLFMCFLGIICCMLVSCDKEEVNNMNTTGEILQGFHIDNTSSLSSILKNTYSLQEFKDYFGEFPPNVLFMYNSSNTRKCFTIEDVNNHFPIECIRQNGDIVFYSIYNVAEGGYFYIFWANIVEPLYATDELSQGASVCFVTYISSLRDFSDFSSIKEESSTAEDVAQIDQALEISFLISSGIRSFSLLKDGQMLEILYSHNDEIKARNDLLVKKISVISKEKAQTASYLASIYAKDLP